LLWCRAFPHAPQINSPPQAKIVACSDWLSTMLVAFAKEFG
jgi:hypothetical protein